MGQLKSFATSRVSFWLGKCHFFEKKRNSFKIGFTVYAGVPLHWFTQVCPCMKRKLFFFCFFLKIACSFTLRLTDKEKKEKIKKNIFFTRCGLSSTYHLVPLTLLQYDTKPTRQYDSIMLIHDLLDTEVFSLTSALY